MLPRRSRSRPLTVLLALAFLASSVVRPLMMSASAPAAPHHPMAGGLQHHAAAPAHAGQHASHQAPQSKHCTPDDCCALCVSACTISVAAAAGSPVVPATERVLLTSRTAVSQSPHSSVQRYRQPLPIGPPASRA